MKSKKAQEGIIVTVLLVLIAIAAVGAVAYFIINSVKGGAVTATDKTDCFNVVSSLNLNKARATYNQTNSSGAITSTTLTEITLSRGSDSIVLRAVNIYVEDKLITATATIPSKLEVATTSIVNSTTKVNVGSKVRINAVLNSTGYTCENGAEIIAIA